jgi:hypothetical protein
MKCPACEMEVGVLPAPWFANHRTKSCQFCGEKIEAVFGFWKFCKWFVLVGSGCGALAFLLSGSALLALLVGANIGLLAALIRSQVLRTQRKEGDRLRFMLFGDRSSSVGTSAESKRDA